MNYYEMLDFPCEGAAADNIKNLQKALDEWEKKKTDALNNETNGAKRMTLQQELAELPNMRELLTDAALRNKHKNELKNARLSQVASIISIMDKSRTGAKRIAKVRIDKVAIIIGLQSGTVKKQFQDSGYTVVEHTPYRLNDFLLADSVLNTINGGLTQVRDYMNSHPNEQLHDLVKVKNLYEYIAIMSGKTINDAGEYELMPTDRLSSLFDDMARTHVNNSAPILYYKDIEAQAKTRVMKDDTERSKYNNSLKLQELAQLFELLKSVPDTIKLERTFADECIREIQRLFPDEDQAFAIYNKYGSIATDTPYEKENPSIATMCTCHILNYHDTREQAERANCVSCGKPLYVECPKCKKKVPAISDFCTCGFFMKGIQSFPLHKQRFNTAVKNADLVKAQDEYDQARVSDPANPDLVAMSKALKSLVDELGRPIDEINILLNAGNLNAAQQKINALKAARPNANVEQYQRQITTTLAWADGEYRKLNAATDQGTRIELAVQILERVKDYSPALEWLRNNKPLPVLNVNREDDSVRMSCAIQWKDNPNNRYVTYTLVRKEMARPQNIHDGTQLASGLTANSYKDTNITPGKLYVYAVFAVRGDAVSAPTHSQGVCLLQNISDVQISVSSSACTLAWQDIRGSQGVCILRSNDGGRTYSVLCDCARGSYSDSTVRNNTQYRYKLKTVWEVAGRQCLSREELVRDVFVEPRPNRIDIQLVSVGDDGNCRVRWNGTGTGTIRLLALNAGITVVPDQVYSQDNLSNMGSTIHQGVAVTAGGYSWYAIKGQQYRVVAFRSFGGDFVGGRTIRVSTVPALQIDENRTTVANDTLNLYLTGVPNNVSRIFYLVSTNGTVCTEQSAVNNTLQSVDIATFRRNGVITVDHLQQEMLTVSVLAKYGDGATAYYSPVTQFAISNLPRQSIKYWIAWREKSFSHKRVRDGAKLYVSVGGNRLPEMELCCREDGKMIFNYVSGAPGIVQLLKISSEQIETGKVVGFDIPEDNMKGVPKGARIQLFLSARETNNFTPPIATDINCCIMPAQ